jgi:hypothetical protein
VLQKPEGFRAIKVAKGPDYSACRFNTQQPALRFCGDFAGAQSYSGLFEQGKKIGGADGKTIKNSSYMNPRYRIGLCLEQNGRSMKWIMEGVDLPVRTAKP